MELEFIFLFIFLIIALFISFQQSSNKSTNSTLIIIGTVLCLSMVLLTIGNSIGLAIMAIISLGLFFYFMYYSKT